MGDTEKDASSIGLQRVKVYRLNEAGNWDDKGTGQVTVEYLEASQTPGLVVIAEEDLSKTLLIHKISADNNYQQSGEDTIITWTDSDIGVDVALSFQEVGGCTSVWEEVRKVQQGLPWPGSGSGSKNGEANENGDAGPSRVGGSENGRRFVVDEFEQAAMSPEGAGAGGAPQGPVELPFPELRSLGELAAALGGVSMWQKERAARQFLQPGFLDKLLEIFHQCEDLEDTESLHSLYRIMKGAVLLNDISLLELLFSDRHFMDVVGMLEYDPESHSKASHREWLSEKAVFKEVVPIADPTIRPKIHQTYRYGYIKDVILPRALDDSTFATIASLMLFNNVEVVLGLQKEPDFLPELFKRLEAGPSDPAWGDLLAFLQEMCGLAKHLQPTNCTSLMTRLHHLGLFQVLTIVMEQGSNALKLRAMDVLLSMVSHDAKPLREFLLKQPQQALFGLLIRPLREGGEGGLQEGALEVLRCLLDPEGMTANFERNEFLDVFYDRHISALVGILGSCCEPGHEASKVPPAVLGLIVELLCFCVVHHSYRIKYYILRNNVLSKVLKMLGRRERWLAVAAIRFLRTCLAMKDEFYNRYVVRERLMEPVVEAFLANGTKYNLLNSAVLELVDFVRRENIKSLVQHIVENYEARLRPHSYTDAFTQLSRKHEQASERMQSNGHHEAKTPPLTLKPGASLRQRRDLRELDRDEEAFFKEDADEEMHDLSPSVQSVRDTPSPVLRNGAARPPPRPLVDYGEDDDDGSPSHPDGFLAGGKRPSPAPGSPAKRARGLHIAPISFKSSEGS